MAQKVRKIGIERIPGFLYFIDRQGDVSRAKMSRSGAKKGKIEKVSKVGMKRQDGFLYFIDQKGDVSRSKVANA